MKDDIRERLQEAESEIRRLREERGRADRVFRSARETAEQDENEGTLATAMRAKQAVAEIDGLIEAATGRQITLLKAFGDMEATCPASPVPGMAGSRPPRRSIWSPGSCVSIWPVHP